MQGVVQHCRSGCDDIYFIFSGKTIILPSLPSEPSSTINDVEQDGEEDEGAGDVTLAEEDESPLFGLMAAAVDHEDADNTVSTTYTSPFKEKQTYAASPEKEKQTSFTYQKPVKIPSVTIISPEKKKGDFSPIQIRNKVMVIGKKQVASPAAPLYPQTVLTSPSKLNLPLPFNPRGKKFGKIRLN